jgi:hypothetical protein
VATLVRVLLWQSRLDEAACVAQTLEPDGVGADTFVIATRVRLHLALGDLFAAGVVAHRVPALAADAPVVSRLIEATTRLRLQGAIGDLDARLRNAHAIRALAAAAHLPLRALRADVICLGALALAGRARMLGVAARLGRFEARVPPLLATGDCGRLERPVRQQPRHRRADWRPARSSGAGARRTARGAPARRRASARRRGGVRCRASIVAGRVGAERADLWRPVGNACRVVASAGHGPRRPPAPTA